MHPDDPRRALPVSFAGLANLDRQRRGRLGREAEEARLARLDASRPSTGITRPTPIPAVWRRWTALALSGRVTARAHHRS